MSAYSKYLLSFLAVTVLPFVSSAQSLDGLYAKYQTELVLGIAVVVCVLALLAMMTVLVALRAIMKVNEPEKAKEIIPAEPAEEGVGFWRKLWNRMNDSVPVAKEETIMTSHEYDGIRELDNRLPPWWLYGFYATIVFSIGYLLYFHVFTTGNLQQDEYEREMAEAKAQVEAYLASADKGVDETNVTLSTDQADLDAGLDIYTSQCAACHGQQGQGGVGPNLTDKYWIHGGDIKAIFKTIKYGVPSKGMIAWQSQLSPEEMRQVSSYIYTMEGTNPPNGKEPQGELFERSTNGKETNSEKMIGAGI